jgi:phage shock protein PspC (stress-responsive transcriptional regulator)
MQSVQPSLIARDDTLLGVCAALGEDFGFNPLYLRVALGGLLLVYPLWVVGAYAAAAAVVLVSRLLAPAPRTSTAPQPAAAAASQSEEAEAEPLAIAA